VKVFDPTGQYLMPNVTVFVPSGTLPPITAGPSSCPVPPAGSKTGADGLAMVTTSQSGTVYIGAQIGKWRTVQPVPVTACGSTSTTLKLSGTPSTTVSTPAIAVSTGAGDTLECSLHRMLMDGAVTLFQGAGGATGTGAKPSADLWATGGMNPFDAVFLSCEAAPTTGANPAALATYAQSGGMVFAEHYQYSVFDQAPFTTQNIATWTTGTSFLTGTDDAVIEASPTGPGLKQWLPTSILDSSGDVLMTNAEPAHNATLGTAPTLLLAADQSASVPGAPLLFSWSEGGAGSAGGRVVYADFHVGSASADYGTTPGGTAVPAGATYPTGCAPATTLKPAEVVLLYTLFEDLSCGQ
jgi:hypothetical protein